MTRAISCPRSKSGSILVLRVGYGSSVIPGRCESVSYCKEEYDTGDVIAERCDGRSTCYVDQMLPRYMPCGRMSNYMMVEYECVDSKTILCSAILNSYDYIFNGITCPLSWLLSDYIYGKFQMLVAGIEPRSYRMEL